VHFERQARTCRHRNETVSTLGDGFLSKRVADDVVQYDAAAGVSSSVYVLARAKRRDVDGHAVPDAE
jgi:hypothetical protein